MRNYFIAPRSGEKSYENFESTIRHGVPLSRIARYLDPGEVQTLTSEEVIYAWGNREGTAPAWRTMQVGDVVIFYASKKLVLSGEVYLKKHSPDMALALWPPDENGNPWEYVFFLKNLKYISMPVEIFNDAVGFKLNNIIQGFIPLKPERIEMVVSRYGSVEQMLSLFGDEHSVEIPVFGEKVHVNVDEEVVPSVSKAITRPITLSANTGTKGKSKGFIDFEEKHKNNARIGSLGEEIVLRHERDYLRSIGRADLADKVAQTSKEDTYAGYDITSYDDFGNKKRIEVKSTTGRLSKSFSFFISKNEKGIAEEIDNYFIYLVFDVKSKSPKIKIIDDPFKDGHHLSIEPVSFRVKGEFSKN